MAKVEVRGYTTFTIEVPDELVNPIIEDRERGEDDYSDAMDILCDYLLDMRDQPGVLNQVLELDAYRLEGDPEMLGKFDCLQ